MWPGYVCNLKCVFCYNKTMRQNWRKFDGVGGIREEIDCNWKQYQNLAIDFMGGEFTLHPEVIDIISYCREIGLRPTIITNALRLKNFNFAMALKDAGVHDFLISVHGIGETAERVFAVKRKGLFTSQLAAIDNIQKTGIPFRINTTLIKWNLEELPQIAKLAVKTGALVVNWIMFNPHFFWSKSMNIPFQERYTSFVPYLKDAINICEENAVEVNVRYIPFCLLKGFEKHIYNCSQLPYDHHEWDYNSWHNDGVSLPTHSYYRAAALRQAEKNGNRKSDACRNCCLQNICDGFHSQYAHRYGFDEANPYREQPLVEDPIQFIRHQWKIEELYE